MTDRAPRDYFRRPGEFGVRMNADPIDEPYPRRELAEWQAARLHHAVAVIFRERLASLGRSRAQAAEAIGTSVSYLGRVLRGEVWLSAQMLRLMESLVGDLVIAVEEPHYRLVRRVYKLPRGAGPRPE